MNTRARSTRRAKVDASHFLKRVASGQNAGSPTPEKEKSSKQKQVNLVLNVRKIHVQSISSFQPKNTWNFCYEFGGELRGAFNIGCQWESEGTFLWRQTYSLTPHVKTLIDLKVHPRVHPAEFDAFVTTFIALAAGEMFTCCQSFVSVFVLAYEIFCMD